MPLAASSAHPRRVPSVASPALPHPLLSRPGHRRVCSLLALVSRTPLSSPAVWGRYSAGETNKAPLGLPPFFLPPFFFIIILFIFLWPCWVFVLRGLSLVSASGSPFLVVVCGHLIAGASLCCGARALGCAGLGNCGAWARLL